MADRKPIRWFVPQGGESFMGIAAYYLTHEENMRQSFSQPSRSATRMLPDGTRIDYIMNDVVDCIRISPPQRKQKPVGKKMTWDKLPPFEEGTTTIDLSLMTEDPDVEGGYYCTVSVINGMDENGRTLPAEFSVEMGESSIGWSIEQGIRQTDGSYKVDGKSATLLLGADADGDCDIIARDGKTTLKKKMTFLPSTIHEYTEIDYSIYYDENIIYTAVFAPGGYLYAIRSSVVAVNAASIILKSFAPPIPGQVIIYHFANVEVWSADLGAEDTFDNAEITKVGDDIVGDIYSSTKHWAVLNDTVTLV